MANIFPNIISVRTLNNTTRCTAQSSVPSSHLSSHNFKRFFFGSDIDHNDHYYHDPYSDMSRLSLVDKARDIGQIQARYTKKWMVEFVSGVHQDNVLLGQHESRPEPIRQLWDQLGRAYSYQSHHRHHAISPVRLWFMRGMMYHSSVVQRLIFSMRRRY